MATPEKNTLPAAPEPEGETRKERSRYHHRGQIRLAISIPALMVLFCLAYGIASLQLFDSQWAAMERAGADEVAVKLLRGHLYTMLILSLLAFITGLGLAFAILRPIAALRRAARQVVASGEFTLRAPQLASVPELGDLSRSFNSMIEFVNESIQERNRYLIDGIVTGLLTLDRHGRVTALNSTGAKILGLRSEALLGHSISDLRDSFPSKYHPLWDYLEDSLQQERSHMPDEVVLRSGGDKLSLLVAMSTLKDSRGKLTGVVLNFRDAAEIRTLHAQLSKTDQLAALGTFSMGLAHELRNPLSSIKGIVQLLKLQDRSKEKDEYLDRIVQEINRLDRFVGELLDFSNQSPTPPVSCRLNEVMRSAAQLIRTLPEALQEKKIELVEAYGEVPESMIEPDRLSRAFANIIRNAYEAAAPGSKVTLKTETRSEGGEKFAVAIVHNTGSTISEEDRRKIFLPFFTTKERGTGLGLAIAHQIITQQHGQLILLVGPSEVSFVAKFKIGQDSGVWAQVPDAHGDDPAVRREVVQV